MDKALFGVIGFLLLSIMVSLFIGRLGVADTLTLGLFFLLFITITYKLVTNG